MKPPVDTLPPVTKVPGGWSNWVERINEIILDDTPEDYPPVADALLSPGLIARLRRAAQDAAECGVLELRNALRGRGRVRTYAQLTPLMIALAARLSEAGQYVPSPPRAPLTVPTSRLDESRLPLAEFLAAAARDPTPTCWQALANLLADRGDPRGVPLARLLSVAAYDEAVTSDRLWACREGFGYAYDGWLSGRHRTNPAERLGRDQVPVNDGVTGDGRVAHWYNFVLRGGHRVLGPNLGSGGFYGNGKLLDGWPRGTVLRDTSTPYYDRIEHALTPAFSLGRSWILVHLYERGVCQNRLAETVLKSAAKRQEDAKGTTGLAWPALIGFLHHDEWPVTGRCDWKERIRAGLAVYREDVRVDEGRTKEIIASQIPKPARYGLA